MPLRDYQQDAVDAVISHIRRCTSSCVIDCPTGSGKSWIAAYIARAIIEMSRKRVLVLAPSAELVEQNHEKYLATGNPASIYSASTGRKELRHDVVFGSPGTVVNSLQKFGSDYAAVVIDEAHGVTPTIIKIIAHMREQNPKLRVIGMSATPYRMLTGYIYGCHYERGYLTEEEAINPFFDQLVYSIPASMLIERGYLTPPVFTPTAEHYDTSGLKMKKTGKWDDASVNQAFTGHGRKTALIVSDVVEKSQLMNGVMFFAATVQHAQEVCASLPDDATGLVTGMTGKQERRDILQAFQNRRIKYLVNVSCLTTGFDATHVDHVAILRATESPGLLQQIIGRGLRLDDDKKECLISDYAENVERHFPDGDVFNPEITTRAKTKGEDMTVPCPLCSFANEFRARPNLDEHGIDSEGYFTDLAGDRIMVEEKPLPAHYGRRCTGYDIVAGQLQRCGYKWSFKECKDCGAENDIAARYCTSCKSEIVDPNEKLREMATKLAADPYATKFDDVVAWSLSRHPGKEAKPDCLKVEYLTADHSITDWYHPESPSDWIRGKWRKFCTEAFGRLLSGIDDAIEREHLARPVRVAYRKDRDSKRFTVVGVDYEN